MLRVAFLHPDLGIGGAERLIVDAAVGLQNFRLPNGQRKYDVTVFTSHHDTAHCYEETKSDLRVVVYGDALPTSLRGGGAIVCAIARNVYAASMMLLRWAPFDVVICDQLSVSIALLRLRARKIVFYCHFPDLHLSKRTSALKRLYRVPFDWLERVTTGMADRCLVNSQFTASVFADTFPALVRGGMVPHVLYPAINDRRLEADEAAYAQRQLQRKRLGAKGTAAATATATAAAEAGDWSGYRLFVSINRFERKKNIRLAVAALAALRDAIGSQQFADQRIRLVIAGGYDGERVAENREHHLELVQAAADAGFTSASPAVGQLPSAADIERATVLFVRSFSDAAKVDLIKASLCVLYTPENEHFGIVPIEAMFFGTPVIACASGGPRESILSTPNATATAATAAAVTGFLIGPNGVVDTLAPTAAAAAVAPAANAGGAARSVSSNQFVSQTASEAKAQARFWADAMFSIIEHPARATVMGARGKRRVLETFSLRAFTAQFDASISAVLETPSRASQRLRALALLLLVVTAAAVWAKLPLSLMLPTTAALALSALFLLP